MKRPLCPTYCDLVRNAFGETGFAIANIALVSFQVSCTIAYVVLASHNLSLVYAKLSQQEWCYILIIPVGLLCLLKSPKGLAPFSLLANLSLLCVIVFVSWFSGSELLKKGISSEVVAFNRDTFLSSIGIFIFSFEGVTLVLPLFNTMKSQHQFKPIFATTLSILCTIYVFYAVGAYFAFGNTIDGIITKLIPLTYGIFSDAFVAVALVISYPLMMLPVFELIEKRKFLLMML
ncbi:hypothetical protein GEMRC1_001904 [Eukaryota sp. GEM-RC1]